MIEAYVTNFGKYDEGKMYGEYITFPATKEKVKGLLTRIGVDGAKYKDTYITEYKSDIEGLSDCLSGHANIDEINYLSSLLAEADEAERAKFEAVINYGDCTASPKDLINLVKNLDCYDYFPGVENLNGLGRHLILEMGLEEIPERLKPYINYHAYGCDFVKSARGGFANGGYVLSGYENMKEQYRGLRDIPGECKVFAYPGQPEKMPIKKQLEAFSRLAAESFMPERAEFVREAR